MFPFARTSTTQRRRAFSVAGPSTCRNLSLHLRVVLARDSFTSIWILFFRSWAGSTSEWVALEGRYIILWMDNWMNELNYQLSNCKRFDYFTYPDNKIATFVLFMPTDHHSMAWHWQTHTEKTMLVCNLCMHVCVCMWVCIHVGNECLQVCVCVCVWTYSCMHVSL